MSFNEINAVENFVISLTPWPLSQVERGVQCLGTCSDTAHSPFSSPFGVVGRGKKPLGEAGRGKIFGRGKIARSGKKSQL